MQSGQQIVPARYRHDFQFHLMFSFLFPLPGVFRRGLLRFLRREKSPCRQNQHDAAQKNKPIYQARVKRFAFFQHHDTRDKSRLIARGLRQNTPVRIDQAGNAVGRGADDGAAVFHCAADDGGKVLLLRGKRLEPCVVALRDQQVRAFGGHRTGVARVHRFIADERAEGSLGICRRFEFEQGRAGTDARIRLEKAERLREAFGPQRPVRNEFSERD